MVQAVYLNRCEVEELIPSKEIMQKLFYHSDFFSKKYHSKLALPSPPWHVRGKEDIYTNLFQDI